MKVYTETFECNGIDYTYSITHLLNTTCYIEQLVDDTSNCKVADDDYSILRDSNNTLIITFKRNPPAKTRFTVILLAV